MVNFYRTIFRWVWVWTIILISYEAFGSGPMTHMGETKRLMAGAKDGTYPLFSTLSPIFDSDDNMVRAILASILPDFQAGVELGFFSHDLNFAKYLLDEVVFNSAYSAKERAFAFGYAAHSPSDLATHQFVVPYLDGLSAVGAIHLFNGYSLRSVGNNEDFAELLIDLHYGNLDDLRAVLNFIVTDPSQFYDMVDLWLNLAEAYFGSVGDRDTIKQGLQGYVDKLVRFHNYILALPIDTIVQTLREMSFADIITTYGDGWSIFDLAQMFGFEISLDEAEFNRLKGYGYFSDKDFFKPYVEIYPDLATTIYYNHFAGNSWLADWLVWKEETFLAANLASIGLLDAYFGNQTKLAVWGIEWQAITGDQFLQNPTLLDPNHLPEKLKVTAWVYPLTREKGVATLRIKKGIPGASHYDTPVIAESQVDIDITPWEPNGAYCRKEIVVEWDPSLYKVFAEGFYLEVCFKGETAEVLKPLFTSNWHVYEALLGEEAANSPQYAEFYGNDKFPRSIILEPVVPDTTPPPAPVIFLDKTTFSSEASFVNAEFYSDDPDQLVSEYVYAVGHQPVYNDIHNWKTVSPRDMPITIDVPADLWVGEEIYISVKAKTYSALYSEVTISEKVVKVASPNDETETEVEQPGNDSDQGSDLAPPDDNMGDRPPNATSNGCSISAGVKTHFDLVRFLLFLMPLFFIIPREKYFSF